jgi:hypothetical protein
MTSTTMTAPTSSGHRIRHVRAFPGLVGLTSLGIVVQSVMAGVFLQADGNRDAYSTWITAHGVGADVTTVLAFLAVVAAFVEFGRRSALTYGALALLVAIVAETLLGHLINGSIGGSDHDSLTIIHIPLGMLILALATWLSVRSAGMSRARRAERSAGEMTRH